MSKLGLEIECENVKSEIKSPFFKITHEPMLKGGVEYVLREPLNFEDFQVATYDLLGKFTTETFTQRCSTHLHVDVRGMNFTQIFNFITLYFIFERLLLDLVEEDRVGNLFCLPAYDSMDLEGKLLEIATVDKCFDRVAMEGYKYSSINIASINRLGSLEFRSLHGTKDPEVIINWAALHLKMYEYAMLEGITPSDIVISVSDLGAEELMNKVFGDLGRQFNHLDVDNLIFNGVRGAQCFAFLGDWENGN